MIKIIESFGGRYSLVTMAKRIKKNLNKEEILVFVFWVLWLIRQSGGFELQMIWSLFWSKRF